MDSTCITANSMDMPGWVTFILFLYELNDERLNDLVLKFQQYRQQQDVENDPWSSGIHAYLSKIGHIY